MCFSPYCLQQNMYDDICIQVIPRFVNTVCAVLIAHVHRLVRKHMFYICHKTGFLMILGLRKEKCVSLDILCSECSPISAIFVHSLQQ